MKTRAFLILMIALLAPAVWAQNAQKADGFFQDRDFEKAYQQYAALHKKEPRNVLYTYRLARCEQELGQVEIAIQHFREAGTKYALRNFYLGELCYATYRFEEAHASYDAYLQTLKEDHERYAYTQEQLKKSERASRLFKRVEDIAITDKTSIRTDQLANELAKVLHDGSLLSEENGLYSYTNQRRDRRYTTVATADGGSVICKQEKLLEDWSTLDTLPATINHSKKQNFPYLMADGLTLYYAAESENGLGGWDVYIARFNPATNTYLAPEMLGMPFNSIENDYMVCIDETMGKGVLVTTRNQPAGMVGLYTFVPNHEKKLLKEDDDYKREYAQLKQLRQPQQIESNETEGKEEIAVVDVPVISMVMTKQAEIHLVLNDSVTYDYYDEFVSPEAMGLMHEYENLQSQLNTQQTELNKQREEYEKAESADRRDALAPTILMLEKELRAQKKELERLLTQIRQTEKQALEK
ncbi:MAG: hypothetical protein MJZ89_03975 [Paludibacteraceae bacterium]|nr:hypothetical protein [Paludibacteraceae bacterium]